ncbi:hypothetical protein LZ32DRAFT_601882 [Colletotrichum eremochloae]|nr:hypothetical protein LZ32DRAFT_601882 [Colletotrichum eremochloae]
MSTWPKLESDSSFLPRPGQGVSRSCGGYSGEPGVRNGSRVIGARHPSGNEPQEAVANTDVRPPRLGNYWGWGRKCLNACLEARGEDRDNEG